MKKTGLATLAALLLCAVLASGCSTPEPDEVLYIVGVSQANLIESWQLDLNEEIKQAAGAYKNVKVMYADAGGSEEKQSADIEDMLAWEVDAIIVTLCSTEAVAPMLQKAYESGIEIIEIGDAPDAQYYSARIYTDNRKIGVMAGECAAGLLGGKGIVLEMQGDVYTKAARERKEGFLEALESYPEIIKRYVVIGGWTRDGAATALKASTLLERELVPQLIFAHNDEMAIGASKVAEEMSLDIMIIGVDALSGENKGLTALKDGWLDATISNGPGGREAVEYVVRLLGGETIPREIELEPKLYTAEDVR